jgi:hypothetical protein
VAFVAFVAYRQKPHPSASAGGEIEKKDETMTIDQRAWATEIDGYFHAEEDRAWATYHPGQPTIAWYLGLDRVEPWELTTPYIFRVKTHTVADKGFEYFGVIDGWMLRTELPNALLCASDGPGSSSPRRTAGWLTSSPATPSRNTLGSPAAVGG